MRYLDAISLGNNLLKINKIKSHSFESELLLAKALKITREKVLINLEKKIEKKQFNKYKKLLSRRKKKEPIAYIFKNKEFWKYNFFVNQNVLIPRPETEIIVDEVIKCIDVQSSKNIIDIGTGSGCLIISIIKERPKCYGTAIDICKKALKVANFNAKMHHLQDKIKFININVDKFVHNKYDFIISNPPYIKNNDIKSLESDIKYFEPKLALKAGSDGLSEIRKLVFKSKKLLKKNGKLIFEIGNKQENYIVNLLNKNGYYVNKLCKDLNSYPRVVISTKLS